MKQHMKKHLFVSCVVLSFAASLTAQDEFSLLKQQVANPDNETRPVFPVPNARQLQWNRMEF